MDVLGVVYQSIFTAEFELIGDTERLVRLKRREVTTKKHLYCLLGDCSMIRPYKLLQKVENATTPKEFEECIEWAARTYSHPARVWLNFDKYVSYFRWFGLNPEIFKCNLDDISLNPFNSHGPLLHLFVYMYDNELTAEEFLKGYSLSDVENVQNYVRAGDPMFLDLVDPSVLDKLMNEFGFSKRKRFYFPSCIAKPKEIQRHRSYFLFYNFQVLWGFDVASKKNVPKKWSWSGDFDFVEDISEKATTRSDEISFSTTLVPNTINILKSPEIVHKLIGRKINVKIVRFLFHTKQLFLKATRLKHPVVENQSRLEVVINSMIKSGIVNLEHTKIEIFHS